MTSKIDIPLWESMKTPFKEWRQQLTEYFAAAGDAELLDKAKKPSGEPDYLPMASTPAAFIAKCKDHEQASLLVSMTGLVKTSTQLRALKAEDLDDDDIEAYRHQVKRHNAKVDKLQDKLEEWPGRCAAAASKIKIALRPNAEARRAIDKIADDEDELYNILDKLQARFGDMQDAAKAEVLLQHCFGLFRSGVTAEEFTEIVDESHAQVVKQYGETIKVDDLTSVFFEANLRCIPEFKTICSQMAALPEEKQTFDEKKKLFVSALKHEGKINVDADAMQQAVFAMLKRALKTDVKMGGKGKGKERPFKNDRASRLGGAARNEGLNAFFAQGDHEDQGKGAKGGKGKKPPNACHICWKVGHYAHECTGTPHPNSTWVPPNPQPKGKGQLWAGRAQANVAQSKQGGAEGTGYSQDQIDGFLRENWRQMECYAKVKTVGAVQLEDRANAACRGRPDASVHSAMASNVEVSDHFVPNDADKQRRVARPLHQKRARDKTAPERLVELWMDSGASQNLGPLHEARKHMKNMQDLDKEHVVTADANAEPLEVCMRGDLFGKIRVEKGHNKAIDLEFRGVKGLGKWLWSVADLYRKGALVQFAEPALGGSFIKLKHSEEKIPIECVEGKYFRVMMDIDNSPALSYRQKQERNFYTSCLAAGVSGRILAQTMRLGIARNFKFFTDVNFGTDESSLMVNGQTPAAPKENQWRPQQVGALTYFDVAHIGKKWSKDSYSKYMLTARDAAGNFRRRYYLPSLKSLAQTVKRHRNFILRKGFNFSSILADNEFDTQELEDIAAMAPTFDTNFTPPYAHVKTAEADIKAWRLRVRHVMKTARSDPKSKVQIKHWPYASECITDIENMLFCEQSPAQTPWESVMREQPDWSIAQIPLCRIWFFVYPNLRQSAPFADRRAEGIFAGISLTSSSYKILNTATGRMILRPFAACVTREPHEVFDYVNTIEAAEKLFSSNQNPFTAEDRRYMFEMGDTDLDNFSEMGKGNDPQSYQVGLEQLLSDEPSNAEIDFESDEEEIDPAEPDSASDSDDETSEVSTLVCTGKTPKSGDIKSRVMAMEGKTQAQALNSTFNKNGARKKYALSDLNYDLSRGFLRWSTDGAGSDSDESEEHEADWVQVQKPRRKKRQVGAVLYGLLAQTLATNTEAAMFADAVLGAGESTSAGIAQGKKMTMVDALSGKPLQQEITVDMSEAARFGTVQSNELRKGLLQCFIADLDTEVKEPKSYDAGLKDPQQRKHWLDGDGVERKRLIDFKAYTQIPYSEAEATGEYIGHILRIIRIKEVTEHGAVIEREYKVRYAYDESRDPNDSDVEHFAAVLRSQTSRLLNLKACHKGRRVLRGDLVSAFLHVLADEPFYTRYPKGHPDEFLNGVRQAMKWRKLLYGKGNASRGLWHDMAAYLMSLGFTQQNGVDQCLFVHEQRQIDFGLYVDDIEASADDEQLEWLRARFEERYEIKWLGFNSKNDSESSEKSKTFVGIRTEIDHVNKIVTQDQKQLIQKAALRFGWEAHRKRFSPPVHNEPFPKLEEGKTAEAKLHKRYRSKTGFLAHVAVQTRPDVLEHAVRAARRLNDPVPECEKYVDEVLQFLFSTMDQQLVYNCTQELGSTLLMASDAALADTADARSTTGWVSLCAGAAWSWAVETLRLVVLSSTEAEYCGGANACKEVLAQKQLFKAFQLDFPQQYPVLLDNQSAIALACGPSSHHQRTKHVATKYHYQRQLLLQGVVRFQHQATEVQIADILTKDLGSKAHRRHRDVIFGKKAIEIIANKLPDSHKMYLTRHNDELKKNAQAVRLAQARAT